ncbi:hypothetical protein [Allosediminivita pacifica]|uniref:Uncharacterized protein n=1 Tax=Allosediminivita pacifica TaxID=1267769 RepID=A0A2T6ACR3_9RHOB|nr:hypothetical protein [Allosediminivita pacifica]PTX41566.1 hypothetical protein C8N44_12851 [Allosediminivita pacifica]
MGLVQVDAEQIEVQHLVPHVERWTLPKGESIGMLISYSCHCWSSSLDPIHPDDLLRIMDGTRPRVVDMARLEASHYLPDLMRGLDQHRVYVTASERNYAVYNMSFIADDGLCYTAFFKVRPKKGRYNGARHHLELFVESAYHTVQPQKGTKTKLAAVLSEGLKGRMVKYRR